METILEIVDSLPEILISVDVLAHSRKVIEKILLANLKQLGHN